MPALVAPWPRAHRTRVAGALLALLGAAPCPAAADEIDPATACDAQAQRVEKNLRLPEGLLRAIGRVESGRRDPAGGHFAPWPWTLNANGQGRFFDDHAAAVSTVRSLQADGTVSIDVGCFQVNLMHHPQAFRSVEDALDPALNADYAGAFLQELKARTGSWEGAVAAYHSTTPDLGDAYRAKVFAVWQGGDLPIDAEATASAAPIGPVVVHISGPDYADPASGIRVWTPTAAGNAPSMIALPRAATIPAALRRVQSGGEPVAALSR